MTFKKILLAFDGGPQSIRCLECALSLAEKLDGQVAIITVIDPRDAVANVGGITSAELLTDMRLQSQHQLEMARATAGAAKACLEFVREGNPTEEIISAAREWRADLIILGARHHSRLGRLVFGSTSISVIEGAPCPVLAVPSVAA